VPSFIKIAPLSTEISRRA